MHQAYTKILELDEFAGVREQLGLLLTGVHSSEELLAMQHDGVEEWIENGTIEFARLLFKAHIDLRANQRQIGAVVGCDGVERGNRRVRERNLETVFGEVKIARTGYAAEGGTSLFPLDSELNLPARKYSHRLQFKVVKDASKQSYGDTVENILQTTGGKVPKLQAEQIVVESTADFEEFYQRRQANKAEPTSDPLIMSIDQKGIVMRREGLREATRKAAEKEKHKHRTRLSKGEKRQRKRMSTVATVYSVAPHLRTAEMIMGLEERPGVREPKARDKRVWASVEREALTVADEMVQEALRRDPQQERQWVILLDGAEAQLRNVVTILEKYNVKDAIIILDLIHVLEYVWTAAHAFYGEGTEEAERWVEERMLAILHGKAVDVAAGMRRSATLRRLRGSKRKAVDRTADYLLTYKELLQYNLYLDKGLPIATGVIEGACRSLVKDRMDLTGARWSLKGAEAVLKARSLRASGDLDAYWEFHKHHEHQRNHLSRYAQVKVAA